MHFDIQASLYLALCPLTLDICTIYCKISNFNAFIVTIVFSVMPRGVPLEFAGKTGKSFRTSLQNPIPLPPTQGSCPKCFMPCRLAASLLLVRATRQHGGPRVWQLCLTTRQIEHARKGWPTDLSCTYA